MLDRTFVICKAFLLHISYFSFNVMSTKTDCFTDRYGNKIRLDWIDLTSNNTVSRVQLKKSNIWRHINYNHTTRENDLALIFLDRKVDISPVSLNAGLGFPLMAIAPLKVSGWGPRNLDGQYSNRQRITTERYTSNANYNYLGISPDKICTTSIYDDVNSRCIGDSVCNSNVTSVIVLSNHLFYTLFSLKHQGSPLIVDTRDGPIQIGVTSLNACKFCDSTTPA